MPVQTKTLRIPVSDSQDVVDYKLYIEEAPNPVTYDSESVNVGNDSTDDNGIQVVLVELNTLAPLTTKDGTYNLGVVSVDDAGNESSMVKLDNVPLDFEQPNPPGQISII